LSLPKPNVLTSRFDDAALVARERALLVVRRDDVLAQLRTDRLEHVAEVADDREVAQDRVLALAQIVRDEPRRGRARQSAGAQQWATTGYRHGTRILPGVPPPHSARARASSGSHDITG
jgi:hypothetical protein